MMNASQMYKTLEELTSRHDRLRKKFSQFFELAKYLATNNSPIKGIIFEDHLKQNYFSINFCGYLFHFNFSVSLNQSGIAIGCVTCYSVDVFFPTQRKTIIEFSYTGTGAVDFKKPDDIEDQLTIDSEVSAIFLVCHCLLSGMTK